jgi:hypothetical protein
MVRGKGVWVLVIINILYCPPRFFPSYATVQRYSVNSAHQSKISKKKIIN